MNLEDELNIPSEAYLPEISLFTLKICNGSSIEISRSNSIRLSSDQNTTSSASIRCLIVGRQAATSDIRIQHGSISRKHAAFFFMREGELFLIAFGGKHGTFVNGLPIQGSVPLKHGDTIVFGNARESVFTVNEVPKPTSLPWEKSLNDKGEINNKKQQFNDLKFDDKAKNNEEHQLEGNATPITRKDREAEIAAMVASLDEAPEYQKYVRNEDIEDDSALHSKGNLATSVQSLYGLPITQQFHIEASSEPISSISSTAKRVKQTLTTMILDKSGSRLAVGHGQHLKIYDFSGMDRKRTAPFKTILVEDGYIVEHACYSNTGDRILVATSSPQPTVLDRDGNEILQFVRGDQYVLDMARTSGHVHKVTGVDWNPLERDLVLTSSLDGSVRVWNLNGKTQFQKLVCDKVYRIKNARGQRTTVTAVAYHPSGREFAVGTSCGSIQIWNSTKVGPRPDREKFDAHSGGKPITALVFNVDGTKIASRSSSDVTVHVWDTRKLSKSSAPISSCNDVPTIHDKSSCHFSPDGKCLVIGCSGFETLQNGKQQEVGVVRFFLINNETGKPIYDFPSKPGLGVVHVKWHAKLNQIILGFSDASLLVLYDETMSKNGALISMSKAGRKVDSLSELLASRGRNNILVGEIVTPLTDTPLSAKRKNTQDPPANSSKQRRPELPATGIKVGGHTSASATFTQFIARTILNTDGKGMVGQDPREDLFKYHDESDKNSKNRILADKTIEEEEEESRTKKNFN